jgi:hypothetical protein
MSSKSLLSERRDTTKGANQRIIMFTVSIDEKISSNEEAYLSLMNAIENVHNSGLIQDSDFICYNIGSPLLGSYLRSDLQRNMPNFDIAFEQYRDFNNELRERSETFQILNAGKDMNYG